MSWLTPIQRAYSVLADLEERNRRAHLPVFADELAEVLKLLLEAEEGADAGWESEKNDPPGLTYGRQA